MCLGGAVAAENDLPVLHVLATDPWADEFLQDGGTFTVYRSGPTNEALTVSYRMAGATGNGVDYSLLTGTVTIPAGVVSESIQFTPIDDLLVEGTESVSMKVEPPSILLEPMVSAGGTILPVDYYIVGSNHTAQALIRDNESFTPKIAVVKPETGESFRVPAEIDIIAQTADADGWVSRVEFFANGRRISV